MRLELASLLTCTTVLLAACGGDELQPVRSAGPAIGKRVIYTAESGQPERHAFLADTGRPQVSFHLTQGMLRGDRSIGEVYGTGHPRFVSYVEARAADWSFQILDLEALRPDFASAPFVAGARPRVSADGSILAAMLHDANAIPTVGLRALPDPHEVYLLNQPTPPAPTQVAGLTLAPDSARVVWSDDGRLWQRAFSATDLHAPAQSLETTSGVARHLNFTPDSSAILWLEDAGDRIRQRRFADATATTLTPALGTGEIIRDYRLSADGARFVYRATDATGRGRLYLVERATPGTATELTPAWAEVSGPESGTAQFDAAYTSSGWQLRPDGAQVAFRAGGGTTGEIRGLYTVEVAGPGVATLRSVATGSHIGHLGYADAGASLVWTATPSGTLADSRLWRGPSQGAAAPVSVFGPLTFGPDDAIFGMQICGDDTALVRWIDWVAGAVSTGGTAPRHSADLYSAPTDGSASATLLTPANTLVEDFACVQ
jgi:hypothetical protein